MTTEEKHLQANRETIKVKLLKGNYVPTPVRRVEISKESGRLPGIPTVPSRERGLDHNEH